MHRSNDRNAPKLRKGAKLDNQKHKVDGVKGSIAEPPVPSVLADISPPRGESPLAGCRGGAPAGV